MTRALVALAVVMILTHLLAVLVITLAAVVVAVAAALIVNRLGRIDRAVARMAEQTGRKAAE